MKKQSRKALYESIMKDIAKVVKRKLNENADEIKALEDELTTYANENGCSYVSLFDKKMIIPYMFMDDPDEPDVYVEHEDCVDEIEVDKYGITIYMYGGDCPMIDDIINDEDKLKLLVATKNGLLSGKNRFLAQR